MAAKPLSNQQDGAEALALRAVAMVVADEDLLPRFLAMTGSGLDELRQRVNDAEFLGAVLDFVLEDDATVQALAEAAEITPEAVMAARRHLPGGSLGWSEG